jgi:hypothetical protein
MMKKMKKNGTHVPGPFDMKCVVFTRWFLISSIDSTNDFSVVSIEVILLCFTSLVLEMK